MTLRLAVKGAGLAAREDSVAASAGPDAARLSDMAALPEYLRAYYSPAAPPPLRRIPPLARVGLLAALRAMEAAAWSRQPDGAADTALLIGTSFSSTAMSFDFMDSLLDQGPRLSSPTAFSHSVNNMGTGLISLMLGLRGPCQTISQFGLSFAGALHAAALTLHAERAAQALVGMLDERDPRLEACLPGLTTFPPGMPHGGAVFLCVEAADADYAGPSLAVQWEGTGSFTLDAESASPDHGGLSHALDICRALESPARLQQDILLRDAARRHAVRITLRGAAC